MTGQRLWFGLLGVLLTCVSARSVVAQPSATSVAPEADPADALYRRLVTQAIAEYEAASFDEALALFEQAYALRPSARVLRGMGKVYFEQRRYVRAFDAFDAALATDVDPLTPSMQEEVQTLRARSSAYIGTITVTVTPGSASILIDAQPVVAGETQRLDVGAHVLEVAAPSHLPSRRAIEVSGATHQDIEVELEQDAPDVLVLERERGAAIASAVTGLSFVAVTVGSGIWLASRSDALDTCRRAEALGVTCVTRSAIERERRAALGTTAASAAIAVGAGVVFIWLVTGEQDQDATVSSVGCAPTLGGAVCGLGGRF